MNPPAELNAPAATPVAPCSDAEALAALRAMGCEMSATALSAFNQLEGWSLHKVVVPVSLEQHFRSLGELDRAAEKADEMMGKTEDTDAMLRGASLLALVAKGRGIVVKQLREITKNLPQDKPARAYTNLPPVLIQQNFSNGKPAEKAAIPA